MGVSHEPYLPDVTWIRTLIAERVNPAVREANWAFWFTETRQRDMLLVRYDVTAENKEVMADVQAFLAAKFPREEYKMLWLKPTVDTKGYFHIKAYRVLGHHMEEHLENIRKRNEIEEQRKRLGLGVSGIGGTSDTTAGTSEPLRADFSTSYPPWQ